MYRGHPLDNSLNIIDRKQSMYRPAHQNPLSIDIQDNNTSRNNRMKLFLMPIHERKGGNMTSKNNKLNAAPSTRLFRNSLTKTNNSQLKDHNMTTINNKSSKKIDSLYNIYPDQRSNP